VLSLFASDQLPVGAKILLLADPVEISPATRDTMKAPD
jgi:hypothetical protein